MGPFKSESVEGWMYTTELDWLRNRGRESNVMIELGSWKGRSSTALIEDSSGILFCVDTFSGSEGEEELFAEVQTKEGIESVKKQFLDNMKEFMDRGKVFLLNMPAEEAWDTLYDFLAVGQVDFIFIDADHSFESCKADIEAYRYFLKKGGILSGHNTNYRGVIQAIDLLCPGWKRGPGYIWYWEK